MILKVLTAATLLCGAVAANAATITPVVTYAPGASYNTPALTGFQTNSALMVGSLVTVNFVGGTTGSASWTAAGATGTGWSLTLSGDSISTPWLFHNTGTTAIAGFSFDGVPGNTTFDTVTSPDDSPGSSGGLPFSSVTGPAGLAVSALYTNRLLVGGTFYGDEYTKLVVSFGGSGLTGGNTLSYAADTDNADAKVVGGGITPVGGVPEPATWAMMILGFGIAGAAMRRRNVAVRFA